MLERIINPQTRLTRSVWRIVPAAAIAWCLLAIPLPARAQAGTDDAHWVGTWATALVERRDPPAGRPPGQAPQPPSSPGAFVPIRVLNPGLHFNDQTLRQIVRTSVGGDQVRVVFSNVFGTEPLAIGAASVALRREGAAVVPASVRKLRFGGQASTHIPAGAVLFSDPVALAVPALTDLAVDLYLPGETASSGSPITTHNRSVQTHYVSPAGDHTGVTDLPVMIRTESWFFLARVEVAARPDTGVVVAIGDSITDGYGATVDAYRRWPDYLARRIQAASLDMAVLNLGIGGNRVLSGNSGVNALARWDRDVLVQTGVTHVIVLEGINDIGARGMRRASAEELIAGHRQLIARAHARGLTIYGATLTPLPSLSTRLPPIPTFKTAMARFAARKRWARWSGQRLYASTVAP